MSEGKREGDNHTHQGTRWGVEVLRGGTGLMEGTFDNLLNGNAGSDEQDRVHVREVQGDEGEIETEEVKRAVRKLRSGKAGVYAVFKQRW